MAILYGWQRKLNLLPLSLVVVGWVVFSIGFIWDLVDGPKDAAPDGSQIPRTSPLLFTQYLLLVGGPFVYLLGVAQAILPGIASSIVGMLTAFVSSVYMVSAGFHAYRGALDIKSDLESDNGTVPDIKKVLMFGGALFISICWCFVLMLSTSYKTKPKRNQYSIFDPPHDATRRRQKCRAPFTPGAARGLSIPFILLSFAGWCVFVMGLDKLKEDEPLLNRYFNRSPLATYGAITVGPLLYIAALLHAGCSGGASTAMGIFSSILSTVYTVFIGFIVVSFGEDMYKFCELEANKHNCSINHSSLNINLIYIFAGAVGSIFLWSCVLMLRPFYRDRQQRAPGDNVINSSQPQYGTMRMEESFNNSYSSQPLIAESGKR